MAVAAFMPGHMVRGAAVLLHLAHPRPSSAGRRWPGASAPISWPSATRTTCSPRSCPGADRVTCDPPPAALFTSYIIVDLVISFPYMVLSETALSFIGLGLKDPVNSLGVMLQNVTKADVLLNYQWYFIPVIFFIAW
jgi:hypothetical protein